MRILLVEPNYRRGANAVGEIGGQGSTTGFSKRKSANDETLWYPPLGLMKLARFHKGRGDEVRFVRGCEKALFEKGPLFADLWDRVYITTLFTYHFDQVIRTIQFYLEAVGGTKRKIYVGGIMASLMAKEIYAVSGISPITGILDSPSKIGLSGKTNIDQLPPDYSILEPHLYAINDTFYAYTTRGCRNRCAWCGVPTIEPAYIEYIDIKPTIKKLRKEYGDKSTLRLMDNNVLSSRELPRIVDDLEELGFGRGQSTENMPRRHRAIDFNQGLDASFVSEKTMKLLSRLEIRPMRIAFDRLSEKRIYVRALTIAKDYGVNEFSNYMLYNFKDGPRDLYERLIVNIRLNEEWASDRGQLSGKIFSYPMRYAPIDDPDGTGQNKRRDYVEKPLSGHHDWLSLPKWTKRFVRNIELMKGVAHGAISPTASLAWRTIGQTFEEFMTNLYMPEELIRNRNKHERRIYQFEPQRRPGSGKIEEFREFMLGLLKSRDDRFSFFHNAVSENSLAEIRRGIEESEDEEIIRWLKLYLKN